MTWPRRGPQGVALSTSRGRALAVLERVLALDYSGRRLSAAPRVPGAGRTPRRVDRGRALVGPPDPDRDARRRVARAVQPAAPGRAARGALRRGVGRPPRASERGPWAGRWPRPHPGRGWFVGQQFPELHAQRSLRATAPAGAAAARARAQANAIGAARSPNSRREPLLVTPEPVRPAPERTRPRRGNGCGETRTPPTALPAMDPTGRPDARHGGREPRPHDGQGHQPALARRRTSARRIACSG